MDYGLLMKVLLLAILQGVTELFPVSSLGHTVIIPGFLGWWKLTTADAFLPIVVTLHLGTTVALLGFYWRDWVALVRALYKTMAIGGLDADPQGKTIWLLIAGTAPAGLLGLVLEKSVKSLLFQEQWPVLPAAFLVVNGVVLLAAEHLRRRGEPQGATRVQQEQFYRHIEDLTFRQAFLIGLAQALALIPGISRSGVTMAASMSARLSHEEALRFTLLLATPLIGLAALLEIPKLADAGTATLLAAALGGVVAAIAAFLSIKFLTRYFKTGRLTPFAYYCLGAGLISFLFFAPLSLGWFQLPWAGQ
jgi:undecaprenyl-diphosphatase